MEGESGKGQNQISSLIKANKGTVQNTRTGKVKKQQGKTNKQTKNWETLEIH